MQLSGCSHPALGMRLDFSFLVLWQGKDGKKEVKSRAGFFIKHSLWAESKTRRLIESIPQEKTGKGLRPLTLDSS